MSKFITAAVAAICATTLAPSAASAISMQYENGRIGVSAAPGEQNNLFLHTSKTSTGTRWIHVRELMNLGTDLMDSGKLNVRYDERSCKVAYWGSKKTGISCHLAAVADLTIATGDMSDKVASWVPKTPLLISGGSGADTIEGGRGNDKIYAGTGDDVIHGDSPDCCSTTHYGADDTPAGPGHDKVLDGGPGNDRIYGYTGNDWIAGGSGVDLMYGGGGFDFLNYASSPQPVHVLLFAPPSYSMGAYGERDKTPNQDFEGIVGSAYDDHLGGRPESDFIKGGNGNDRIDSSNGQDALLGEGGDDVLLPGPHSDSVYGGPGNDRVEAQDGYQDFVHCEDGWDTAFVDTQFDQRTSCEQDWDSWPGS